MSDLPQTRYAETQDGVNIAYATLGEGDTDFLVIPDWIFQIEQVFGAPESERLMRRVARLGRLIVFDKRGMGLSDPAPLADMASLELWAEDIKAVLDDLGAVEITVLGHGQGGQMAVYFAATAPERTRALALVNAYAFLGRDVAYPWGVPLDVQHRIVELAGEHWGTGFPADSMAPSRAGDGALRDWLARMERYAASPRIGRALQELSFRIDVRHLVGAITVPTLVMHTRDNASVRVGHGRWLAEHISGARYVEVDGPDHWFWVNEGAFNAVTDTLDEFLTGEIHRAEEDRILATVLFTDVVGSTQRAAEVGDTHWKETLDRLDDIVRRQLERYRGDLVKQTGDGHLATFDGPGRAIACAQAIREAVRALNIELRTGLHTGEVEVRGPPGHRDVTGIAVNIAARVMAEAEPGQVLVSSAVPPLVAGSGREFVDRGTRELKGVPGEWQLFEVTS
ncbi:MAG TPA: adenylate/guanylate cyclase domain-containing protein [Acidimicrobiia bacterium]|nr:adenylate/guanylate cyclase domain-containing protein [Acidimicrobiia bacterium]